MNNSETENTMTDNLAEAIRTANEIANTIALQIGGIGRVRAMTGCVAQATATGLRLKFPRIHSNPSMVLDIDYNRGADLYDLTTRHPKTGAVRASFEGIYAESLKTTCESMTGLRFSL